MSLRRILNSSPAKNITSPATLPVVLIPLASPPAPLEVVLVRFADTTLRWREVKLRTLNLRNRKCQNEFYRWQSERKVAIDCAASGQKSILSSYFMRFAGILTLFLMLFSSAAVEMPRESIVLGGMPDIGDVLRLQN